MAVLWSLTEGENHYEVRSAGASVRLYRNGVNHSQWNPNRPLAGSVWDLITLPSLHRENGSLHSALMLGFGAGAAARQIRELAGVEHLVGVELDPIHLSIADGFFECSEDCELIAGDAVEWVQSSEPDTYDYIVDDLYAEEDGIPIRCAPMDRDWFEQLTSLLRPEGILVLNIIEPDKVAGLPPFWCQNLRQRLPHSIGFQLDGYENRVIAFSVSEFDPGCLEANLQSIFRRFPRSAGVDKRYQLVELED